MALLRPRIRRWAYRGSCLLLTGVARPRPPAQAGSRHVRLVLLDWWASDEPDFFVPMHQRHLVARISRADQTPHAAPRWLRFLLAPDYVDVWEDPALLET